jgi:hypothetical protein
VVAVALGVLLEETLPHDDALHETVHVTPLPDRSLLTVAVKLACPPAGTEVESAETETVSGGAVIAGEPLPPPQPAIIVTEVNPRSARAKDAVRFISASACSIFAMAVYNLPLLRKVNDSAPCKCGAAVLPFSLQIERLN